MTLRGLAAWLAAYLAVSFLFLAPLSFHAGQRLPDDGDSLQGLWITWWGATHWKLGYPGILDANGYYPHSKSLLFSEPQLAEALLATPLFALFDNHVLVYNLLLIATLALSALACHRLVRELTGSDLGAALGAIVFVFNAHTLSHLPRIQLVTLLWMPLGLFCFHRFFARREARYLFPFVVASFLQGLASFYFFLFYVVALAILTPFYIAHYRAFRARQLVELAGAAAASGALMLPLTLPYIERFAQYGFSSKPESLDGLAFLTPHPDSLIYGAFGGEPRLVIQFLGFATIVLAALGAWAALGGRTVLPRKLALGYAVVAVAALTFALGPDPRLGDTPIGPGPYRLLETLGLGVRDPGRFAVILRLALAVFVGLAATLPALANKRLGVAVALLLLVEQAAPSRTTGVSMPPPASYRWVESLATGSTGAIAELPVRPFGQIRLNALDAYFSTYHKRPFLFAKPSVYPPAHELLRHSLVDFPSPPTLSLLAELEIETVVVHPRQWSDDERSARLAALDRAEQSGEITLVENFPPSNDSSGARYGLGSERIYRVELRPALGPPHSCECREIDRTTFRVNASGTNDPELAIDSDPDTAWTTGLFLRRGDYFEIEFGTTRRPARIEIELRYPFVDLPRGIEVNGFRGPRFFRFERIPDLAYTVSLVRQLTGDPRGARLRYDLVPMDVDRLRLFVDELAHDVPGWSIPEIHVFEEETSSR